MKALPPVVEGLRVVIRQWHARALVGLALLQRLQEPLQPAGAVIRHRLANENQ